MLLLSEKDKGGDSAQHGRMSLSKIDVGIASVQHALGMSTIPLIRPSTGAQLSKR
tara:strand:- start:6 stop:170 length:165 start_codon:yes stop_codon:yes gene_type:complete